MTGEECVGIYLYIPSPVWYLNAREPRKHAGSLKLNDRWIDQGIRAIEVVLLTWSQIVKSCGRYNRVKGTMTSSARDRRQSATSVPPLASTRSQHAQMTELVRTCTTRSTRRPPVLDRCESVTSHRCHVVNQDRGLIYSKSTCLCDYSCKRQGAIPVACLSRECSQC